MYFYPIHINWMLLLRRMHYKYRLDAFLLCRFIFAVKQWTIDSESSKNLSSRHQKNKCKQKYRWQLELTIYAAKPHKLFEQFAEKRTIIECRRCDGIYGNDALKRSKLHLKTINFEYTLEKESKCLSALTTKQFKLTITYSNRSFLLLLRVSSFIWRYEISLFLFSLQLLLLCDRHNHNSFYAFRPNLFSKYIFCDRNDHIRCCHGIAWHIIGYLKRLKSGTKTVLTVFNLNFP